MSGAITIEKISYTTIPDLGGLDSPRWGVTIWRGGAKRIVRCGAWISLRQRSKPADVLCFVGRKRVRGYTYCIIFALDTLVLKGT